MLPKIRCPSALFLFATSLSALALPGGTAAQSGVTDETGWNDPTVLALVSRARQARRTLAASADLQTYEAQTEGHVYFFIDPEQGERYLIRIDQIATEVRWVSPDILRQRVVGERSETRLPVRDFDYYLDRLTLVPHGFADEIRIGSGLDVRGVRHPFAETPSPAQEAYDFRLGESLSLRLPGRAEPVEIREILVRPRDPDEPGFLGTIHVDLASGSIVRMAFTFTPSSYVDPRNDRVSVELDYGLWEGRYWLPNVQRIEVRREMPKLDIGIGTVIRAVLQVRDYSFDVPLRQDLFATPPVLFAPAAARQEYPFDSELYENLEEDGFGEMVVDPDLGELRARALERLGTATPSGLAPVRLHYPGLSSLFRYGRAEGARVGVGASARPKDGVDFSAEGAYATASERLQGQVSVEQLLTPQWALEAGIRARARPDLGIAPGSAPLMSTLGALTRGEDYLDPFWVTGGTVRVRYSPDPSRTVQIGFGLERHTRGSLLLDSAPLDKSRHFRGIRPVENGEFFRLDLGFRRTLSVPGDGRGIVTVEALGLRGQAGSGIGISVSVDERWGLRSPSRDVRARAESWSWLGDPLPQGHRLLGGRGTIPGFAFREWLGQRAVFGSLIGSADLWGPLVRIRGGAHAGWADGGNSAVAALWQARGSDGVRTALSLGLGFGWDIVGLDLARGLGGGEWQLLLSLDRRWWERL